MLEESEPDHAVKDNAAGALAKMIMAKKNSVPLNQVCTVKKGVLQWVGFQVKMGQVWLPKQIFVPLVKQFSINCK